MSAMMAHLAKTLNLRLQVSRIYRFHPWQLERVVASSPWSCYAPTPSFCSFHSGKNVTTDTITENTSISTAALPLTHVRTNGNSARANSSYGTTLGVPGNSEENGTSSGSHLLSAGLPSAVPVDKFTIHARDLDIALSWKTPPDIIVSYTHSGTSGTPQAPPSNSRPFILSDNPLNTPRENTVAALWEQLQQVRVIHVRGTPASGKSTLADLLKAYVEKERPDIDVHLFNWPLDTKAFEYRSYYHLINEILGEPKNKSDTWLKRQNTLVIVDEAQRSYKFINFWNEFIKPLASESQYGPCVILFSSFGSPAAAPIELPPESGSAPIEFRLDQRVSIQSLPYTNPKVSLYFNHEEFKDAVARLCTGRNRFIPSEQLMQCMWDLTNGHPAGVRALVEILMDSEEVRLFRKESKKIPLDAALEYMADQVSFMKALENARRGFPRSLPKREDLQRNPGLELFLREVLASGKSIDALESNTALDRCYKKGWLQAELVPNGGSGRRVYVFPSKLHEMYMKHLLSSDVPEFPQHQFSSVRDLCFAAVRKFSPTLLSSGWLAAGGVVPPVEDQYRHELSRACYHILGCRLFLTSEWKSPSYDGRVDFYIKPVKWAIECAREGNKLRQHISRFQPGGIYYPLIAAGEIRDYILLDFRTSKPDMIRDDVPFLYFVIFSKDYASYEIYDAKLNLVVKKVLLLSRHG